MVTVLDLPAFAGVISQENESTLATPDVVTFPTTSLNKDTKALINVQSLLAVIKIPKKQNHIPNG